MYVSYMQTIKLTLLSLQIPTIASTSLPSQLDLIWKIISLDQLSVQVCKTQNMGSLLGLASLKKTDFCSPTEPQLPKYFQQWWNLMNSSITYSGMLAGLNLHRSCPCSHSCWESRLDSLNVYWHLLRSLTFDLSWRRLHVQVTNSALKLAEMMHEYLLVQLTLCSIAQCCHCLLMFCLNDLSINENMILKYLSIIMLTPSLPWI